MKKLYFFFIVWGLMISLFSACSDDDDYIPTLPIVGFAQGNYSMELTDSIVFRAEVTNALENTFSWALDNDEVSTGDTYVFKAENSGTYQLALTAKNSDGTTTKTATITVNPGKYKNGTFILNEGLMGTCGSLIFISPEGNITGNAYFIENGKRLPGLTQDLFIYNNKMYIIAQQGTDASRYGSITILNAETLKEEFYYSFPGESNFTSPTHVAVLGEDDIYIRDERNGISVFHPSDSTITKIDGSEGAHKNTMAAINGKVFAAIRNAKSLAVIQKGKTNVTTTIKFDGDVSGVIKSSDGKLWVSDESGKISKVDPNTYEIIASNQLTGGAAERLKINPVSSQTAAPHITAKGDTLYMSATTTNIYGHIFSKNITIEMLDAKRYIPVSPDYWEGNWTHPFVYNTCAVDPITGEVYLNSLKGIGGERHINHISVFDFTWHVLDLGDPDFPPIINTMTRLSRDYANYLDYPANVYFTYNFQN